MVNGGIAVQGRHYRVVEDTLNYFESGTEVVALENNNVPYCVDVKNFNGSVDTGDYLDEDYWPECVNGLEEMEGNSSEIKD